MAPVGAKKADANEETWSTEARFQEIKRKIENFFELRHARQEDHSRFKFKKKNLIMPQTVTSDKDRIQHSALMPKKV